MLAARKPWLLAAAAILLGSAPVFAVCDVPTVKGSNVRGRVHALAGSDAQRPPRTTVRLLTDAGKVVAEVLAGQDGSFSISAPERGRYGLAVTAEGFLEVRAVVVVKKLGKDTPFLRVDLGSDAGRPCGGGGITVPSPTGTVTR